VGGGARNLSIDDEMPAHATVDDEAGQGTKTHILCDPDPGGA